jgi:quinol monooxygenase YgiN
MTNNHVSWILEIDINDSKIDDFKALMAEMVSATQADEPDALNYEWFISDDAKHCHIYERYSDSTATMTHLGNFGAKFAERFLGMVAPTRLTVYGDPSAEARAALAGLGAVHMELLGGFAQ